MKKICLFFVGLFCFGAVAAQVPYDTVTVRDPDYFTLATTIDTALVQVISRKGGQNRRINFQTVKSYSTPDITLAWLGIDIEDTTGIATTYRDFFVTDNEGEVWFVDNAGRARKLYDPAQFQDLTISDDTIYISDGNFAILPGIAGTTIDSISYYSDTLRIYEGGDTIPFKVEILGGLSDGDYGHIDVSGSGTVMTVDTAVIGPTQIASTAVTPGSYTRTSLTVDADGRITAASSGASDADGNGMFSAINNSDSIEVSIVNLRFDSTFRINYNHAGESSFIEAGYSPSMQSTSGALFGDLDVHYLRSSLTNGYGGTEAGIWAWQDFTFMGYKSGTFDTTGVRVQDEKTTIIGDTLDLTGVVTFLGLPAGADNQTIDTFSRSGSTIYLSLEDDGQAAKQLNLSVFLQTLDTDRDTLSISGSGTILRTPGPGFLRDSITGAALTINLKSYNQAIVEIRMESCTSTTLTVTNPWSSTDIDATYPTFEGEAGVYTFHFLGISGTDNITWPADFLDMNGTALGTDALTTGTAYTCYRNPVSGKYYCK